MFPFLFFFFVGFYTMRMLEPNGTNSNNNTTVLTSANAAGSLNSNGAGLLPNATGASQMQTTLNGSTATGDRLDASSDSAVSSMGSERVPSLSDSEWGDPGSDSAQEYHHRWVESTYTQYENALTIEMTKITNNFWIVLISIFDCSKYGPYDYSSYSGRIGDAVRHPVAQKKHQMFGKTRYLQDQSGPNM